MRNTDYSGPVSQRVVAACFAVAPATVAAWIGRGCPVATLAGRAGGSHGFILRDVYRWLLDQRISGDDDQLDAEYELAALRVAQRAKLELQTAALSAELIPATEAHAAWRSMSNCITARIGQIPEGFRSRVPDAPSAAQALLAELLVEALADLGRDPLLEAGDE